MKQIIFAVITLLLFVGCNSTTSKQIETKSKLQRELNPVVNQTELKELVEGNNEFAFSLYNELNQENKNSFISPLSISHALVMTYLGANGETKDEMRMALGLMLDDSRIGDVFNKLDLELNVDDQDHIFQITNAIWPSNDLLFEEKYLDDIMLNFGAGLRTLDYKKDPEGSRVKINDWVASKTKNRIQDLIPKGAINSLTKMVLSNATYFKGKWEYPFDEKNTQNGVFNDTIDVEYMNQTEVFPYYEDENLQAVKLRYKTGKSAMIIILSKNKSQPILSKKLLQMINDGFKRYRVTLKMPKFKFTSDSISLTESMKKLGMNHAFYSDKADFSKISKNADLYISDILHKTFIKVDEYGTQAAAATAVLIEVTGIEDLLNANMTIDKTFTYLIIDEPTEQILFLGQMAEPK
jgi:serpin B